MNNDYIQQRQTGITSASLKAEQYVPCAEPTQGILTSDFKVVPVYPIFSAELF